MKISVIFSKACGILPNSPIPQLKSPHPYQGSQPMPNRPSLFSSALSTPALCSVPFSFFLLSKLLFSQETLAIRQLNVFSSGLAQLIVSTSHVSVSLSQLPVRFCTPINCEAHGRRRVSFSETPPRPPRRLVHNRCQRASFERTKKQTDEEGMNKCTCLSLCQ